MQAQVRCQECHRLVSCDELRLGVGGRKLCCDCYPEESRSPWMRSRLDWQKAEESGVVPALADPLTKADSESSSVAAEAY